MSGPVMVFIEQNEGKITDVSLELVSEARLLADKLGACVSGIAIGFELKNELEKPGHYGCDKIHYIEDRRLAHFTSVPYAKCMVNIIKKYEPSIVLYGATTTGRDIAPRIASELGCGLTADCTKLEIGSHKIKNKTYENTLLQIRPAFGGNIVATIVSPESFPSMATVREGVMKIAVPDTSKSVEITDEPCPLHDDDFLTEVIEIIRKEKNCNLKNAKIIVAAGMGASSSESLSNIKELAHVLGGEIGSSRPVVDAGLLEKDHQVGQTGVTVRPNLYIACGISGQIQHRAGMMESKRIIAINSDPDAPIFQIAHYGIVGDINEIIPKMIKAYHAL
ncbi:MAG: electron transfer flavoprotein subunit alpha/FixB family protein [Bacteriovoracaceae bacterium]|nr:electron transfer flavoprotein subunit alpha/FixB family protein [Bacteriovoracaceae bacterium]